MVGGDHRLPPGGARIFDLNLPVVFGGGGAQSATAFMRGWSAALHDGPNGHVLVEGL